MLSYNNPIMTLRVNMQFMDLSSKWSYDGLLCTGQSLPQYNMDRSDAEVHAILKA